MTLTIKQTILYFFIGLGILLNASLCMAEISVIVNPNNTNTITESDIKKIYLGKNKSFPDGSAVSPVDQKEGSKIRVTFGKTILNKSEKQLKPYWAKMLFTGKATPPRELADGFSVKEAVGRDSSAIGYIDSSIVDDSVKVIFSF